MSRDQGSRRLVSIAIWCALVTTFPGPALGQAPSGGAATEAAASFSYPVSAFKLSYIRDNAAQPPLEEVARVSVRLQRTARGFDAPPAPTAAPEAGAAPEPLPEAPGETVTIRLDEFAADPSQLFTEAALQQVLQALRDDLIRRDLLGVYVGVDPADINAEGRDVRPPGRTALHLEITTGVVTEVRTLASGERIRPEDRVNHPIHEAIRAHSPIQPRQEGQAAPIDLLRRDRLSDYLYRLSRHPGRRVEAFIAPGEEPGTATLDYHVVENKPLVIYGQVSNTGTRETNYWRERFGLIHNQLTNNDDIFSIDYVTAGFESSHAVVASYDSPFVRGEPGSPWRWRVFGSWSEYTASEVGFLNDIFEGETWAGGGEISYNFLQRGDMFVDLLAGVRYENLTVDTPTLQIHGEEDLLIPYIGARLERLTSWFETRGALALEIQNDSISPVDRDELTRLGRFDPDESWEVLRFGLSHSFFLEPVLDYESWRDPANHPDATLAHELAFSVRGQYAFNNRLIPQEELTAGGLYTVRGYPESVVAGDTVVIGTAEYRFHLPRIFGVKPEPGELLGQPFRWAPQQVYGRPDWDLILRAFVDAAYVHSSDAFSFEPDETLVGAGIGAELLIRRNLNLRVDWGFVLEDARDGVVNDGSNRLHFVATILF